MQVCVDKKQKPEGFAFYQKSIKDFYLSNLEIISPDFVAGSPKAF